MRELFFGDWDIEIVQNNPMPQHGVWLQRFKITSSLDHDGYYGWFSGNSSAEYKGVEPGEVIKNVQGNPWILQVEWVDPLGGDWKSSYIRRTDGYTLQDGLFSRIHGEYFEIPADYTGGMILLMKNVEPEISPQPDATAPYDFTITDDMFVG